MSCGCKGQCVWKRVRNACKRSVWNTGCFPLCQRFRKFRSESKWKGPFRFLPTGIFGITSGGGPLISVGIFRPKFAVPFLTNRFFALIREFGKGIKSGKSHSYWLARFNRKMSFHSPSVFPLISDQSVWHNGKHPQTADCGLGIKHGLGYKTQTKHYGLVIKYGLGYKTRINYKFCINSREPTPIQFVCGDAWTSVASLAWECSKV